MNPSTSLRRVAATVLGLAALAASASANARTDIHFSIGVPAPVYVQPAPVYVQPQPVYVQPQPVYVHPRPVYAQPHPVYVQPGPVYGYPRHGYGHGHHWHRGRGGPWGDADRDGVPNRHDRFPGHPYRY